jgi:ATP-dependent RNA helicase RhlE
VEAGIKTAGYTTPTPIQEQSIPAVLAQRDVLGLAQTGTGKTAAFVLPILNRLLEGGKRGTIRALIVAPTRELAEQINQDIRVLGNGTALRSTTVYGGVGMQQQTIALRGRVEIVVACPGRLLDHIERGNADLSKVEVLVLDEADHMFDMGFLPAIRRILKQVPASAQKLLFSATMPEEVRHLAMEVLRNPVTVEVSRTTPVETVTHALYPVQRTRKTELLKHLLKQHDPRSTLIFTRTKHGAKRLAEQLDRDNYFVTSLQGNLSQNRRQEALDGFKEGKYHILVATDIAARGIDISRVSHVINYDVPNTGEAYTHRIGRTGRAQRTGEAFTFITRDDERQVRMIEQAIGGRIARVNVDGFELDQGAPQPVQQQNRGRRPQGQGQRRPAAGRNTGRDSNSAARSERSGSNRVRSQRGNR